MKRNSDIQNKENHGKQVNSTAQRDSHLLVKRSGAKAFIQDDD